MRRLGPTNSANNTHPRITHNTLRSLSAADAELSSKSLEIRHVSKYHWSSSTSSSPTDHSHAILSYINPLPRSSSSSTFGRVSLRFSIIRSIGEEKRGMMMSGGSGSGEGGDMGWEKRPGGMLVQTRSTNHESPPPRLIRVRVSYGAARYDFSVASQATFGELKKLLTAETGLQPAEQSLVYRGKERGNSEFLDVCGLKDRSKVVLMEDPASLEKRYIEMRRNAKIESTHRAISAVSLEVDKLSDQVTAIEKCISSGNKVPEVQITTLIELLMRQAVKLDNITTEGDASSQKNIQAKRVQKCVETLDVLKITNSRVKPVIVTTKWETFETQPTTQWEFFE